MPDRPIAKPRRPGAAPVSEAAAAALEQRIASREGAHKLTSSQAHEPAPQLEQDGRYPRGRGSAASPYRRKDGTALRSTTIYIPHELHRRALHRCADTDQSLSALVTLALERLLEQDEP